MGYFKIEEVLDFLIRNKSIVIFIVIVIVLKCIRFNHGNMY